MCDCGDVCDESRGARVCRFLYISTNVFSSQSNVVLLYTTCLFDAGCGEGVAGALSCCDTAGAWTVTVAAAADRLVTSKLPWRSFAESMPSLTRCIICRSTSVRLPPQPNPTFGIPSTDNFESGRGHADTTAVDAERVLSRGYKDTMPKACLFTGV